METDLDLALLAELRELLKSGNLGAFTDLIGIFLSDTEKGLIMLTSAFESGDYQRVKGVAHRIKGGAGSLGARTMAGICRELEMLPPESKAETMIRLIDTLREEFVRVRKALEKEAGA